MAKALRRPPSVAEADQFRAREYFDKALYDLLSLVGTTTVDVGSIAAGGIGTFTVSVDGAKANAGQGVVVGVPSAFNTGLVPWGYVSADGVVTVVLYNRTGSAIDPASASYSVRVMP
jgi:hypothetical protein